MKKVQVLISINSYQEDILFFLESVKNKLMADGHTVMCVEKDTLKSMIHWRDFDLAIAIGGDGTLVNLIRHIAPYTLPVLYIPMGTLSFLSQFPANQWYSMYQKWLHDELIKKEYIILDISIKKQNGHMESYIACNDVVLRTQKELKLINYFLYIDGIFISSYRADGFIVSTPIGTMAYNFSLGGPIISPYVEALNFQPLANHSLNNRNIIIHNQNKLHITFPLYEDRIPNLTLDGQEIINLDKGDEIYIKQYPKKIYLLTAEKNNFYRRIADCFL